jgi:hypothetical protein
VTDHDTIDYPRLVLGALRQALAALLREVAEGGLPGEHHFFITFRTDAPGVELPAGLRRDHPDELTIVLQHQFWNLRADDEAFSVVLRFAGAETPVRVPYAAMTAFADPSVDFGVQLAVPGARIEPPPGEGAEGADGAESGAAILSFDRGVSRD